MSSRVKPALVITFPKRASHVPSAPTESAALLFQARQSLLRHNWPDAEQRLRRVLSAAPGSVEALNLTGVLQLAQKHYEQALESFEAVLALHERNVCALTYRGELRAQAGQNRAARADLRRAIAGGHPDEALVRRAYLVLASLESRRSAS